MRETFQSHHLFSVLRVLHMLVHFGTVQQHKEDVSLQQRIRSLERIKKKYLQVNASMVQSTFDMHFNTGSSRERKCLK
jgi:hypothetical protein